MVETDVLKALTAGILSGEIQVVDLTHPLSEATPVLPIQGPYAKISPFRSEVLNRYDDMGPWSYKRQFQVCEHVGTHLDAPIHWHTGRDREDVSQLEARLLVGPAVLVDVTEAAACDADYLVSVSDLEGAVERSGPLAPGSWIVLRTGWEARYEDPAAYLNKDDSGCHWPGLAAEAAEWLAGQPIAGFGTDTIGIDAGIGRLLEPSNPAHSLLLGAGKCGLASLNNLSLLPRSGWVLIAAPLKMTGGSGSPMRALALVTAG